MRKIKFRAWVGKMEYDITTGKFGTFFVNSGKRGDGLADDDSAILTPFNTKLPNDCPVMQYTGLLDASGKEIYEGDIVKKWEGRPLVVEWTPTPEVWKCFNYYDDPSDFEVIGNIYQNPELLTK